MSRSPQQSGRWNCFPPRANRSAVMKIHCCVTASPSVVADQLRLTANSPGPVGTGKPQPSVRVERPHASGHRCGLWSRQAPAQRHEFPTFLSTDEQGRLVSKFLKEHWHPRHGSVRGLCGNCRRRGRGAAPQFGSGASASPIPVFGTRIERARIAFSAPECYGNFIQHLPKAICRIFLPAWQWQATICPERTRQNKTRILFPLPQLPGTSGCRTSLQVISLPWLWPHCSSRYWSGGHCDNGKPSGRLQCFAG